MFPVSLTITSLMFVAQASPLWMHHSPPLDTFISLVRHLDTNTPLSDMTRAGKEFLGRQTHPLSACSIGSFP